MSLRVRQFLAAPAEMRLLLVAHRYPQRQPQEIARMARLRGRSIYMAVRELRKDGLIYSETVQRAASDGRMRKTILISTTARGDRKAQAFLAFLRALGRSLCESIGWIQPSLRAWPWK